MSNAGKIVEGVMAVNKPAGISSAQVLRELQKHFNSSSLFAPWLQQAQSARDAESANQRHRRSKARRGRAQVKIGHGGTLDPAARGVLVTGIGRGTKALASFLECTKTYEAVILFGAATDTYDQVGKIIERKAFDHVNETLVKGALEQFRGKYLQRPPIFSALRMDGKRLYEYAREGKVPPVEIKARPVEVLELELVEWLEGGSHEFKWPSESAKPEEIKIAQQVARRQEKAVDENTSTDKLDVELNSSPSLKRKLDEATKPEPLSSEQHAKKPKPAVENVATDEVSDSQAKPLKAELLAHANADLQGSQDELSATSDSLPPAARLRMTVGSGFYVRSLCDDLGRAVNSLGIMADLVRSRQAKFVLGQNVLEYDDLDKGESVWGPQVEIFLDEWTKDNTSSKSDS